MSNIATQEVKIAKKITNLRTKFGFYSYYKYICVMVKRLIDTALRMYSLEIPQHAIAFRRDLMDRITNFAQQEPLQPVDSTAYRWTIDRYYDAVAVHVLLKTEKCTHRILNRSKTVLFELEVS